MSLMKDVQSLARRFRHIANTLETLLEESPTERTAEKIRATAVRKPVKKKHWTQTAKGKRILRASLRASWRERKAS